MDSFYQSPPELAHPFHSDIFLQSALKFFIEDEEKIKEIESDLIKFSDRILNEINELGLQAEAQPPVHIPYDPWGRRIDKIEVCPQWRELDRVSAQEGLVARGYERDSKGFHRLHQFAKLYLFHPASSFYSCPLAMTDGAAKLIEVHGDKKLKERAFKRLTSRNPEMFWTSGQWMTERTGGSDVGRSETVARLIDGGWRLYGTKWFTSATTSQMAMTLARIEDEKGESENGSRGLSLFYLELRDENENLQNIVVNRLKDKLGTKALPTAELTLNGTPATLVGEKGRGVAQIATLFNVTRIYNSCCSLGAFRRLLSLAEDYSQKRQAFGKKLIDHPLHAKTLQEIRSDLAALTAFSFFIINLLDRDETLSDGDEKLENAKLLRLLTPVAKLFSAKINMESTSELIESFGGAGYVEDTGLPRWLRDAQVLTIWEGATNVLALDTLRAVMKDQPMESFFKHIELMIEQAKTQGALGEYMVKCREESQQLQNVFKGLTEEGNAEKWELAARELAFSIARLTQGVLLGLFSCSEKLSQEQRAEYSKAIKVMIRRKWVDVSV